MQSYKQPTDSRWRSQYGLCRKWSCKPSRRLPRRQRWSFHLWREQKWVLSGAVSWGDSTCKTNYYTVFAPVSSFIDWINQKMSGSGEVILHCEIHLCSAAIADSFLFFFLSLLHALFLKDLVGFFCAINRLNLVYWFHSFKSGKHLQHSD